MLRKICKKTVPAESGNNKPVSPLEAKTHEYSQTMKAHEVEIRAAGDEQPKHQQMIQPSITGALASYTLYDSRRKSKQLMEISDVAARWESSSCKQLVKKLDIP